MGVLTVAVIDDQRINRVGTAVVLSDLNDVEVTATLDFDEAQRRATWAEFDWVVIDVADEGLDVDEVPSVRIIERIREVGGPDRPVVIAVTSNPIAFDEDVIRRRLLEAGADFFVWRADLDRLLSHTSTLRAVAEDLPGTRAPNDIPMLGVTGASSVNAFVNETVADPDFHAFLVESRTDGERRARWLSSTRERVARSGRIEPTTAEGNRPRHGDQDIPGLPQLRHLFIRATRVSRRRPP